MGIVRLRERDGAVSHGAECTGGGACEHSPRPRAVANSGNKRARMRIWCELGPRAEQAPGAGQRQGHGTRIRSGSQISRRSSQRGYPRRRGRDGCARHESAFAAVRAARPLEPTDALFQRAVLKNFSAGARAGFPRAQPSALGRGRCRRSQDTRRAHAAPPMSLEKMSYDAETGTVICRSRMHAGLKRNFQVMPGAEWLELLCRHIPDRYEPLVRYVGWYSNRARGERAKALQGPETTPTSSTAPVEPVSEFAARAKCPGCKGPMQLNRPDRRSGRRAAHPRAPGTTGRPRRASAARPCRTPSGRQTPSFPSRINPSRHRALPRRAPRRANWVTLIFLSLDRQNAPRTKTESSRSTHTTASAPTREVGNIDFLIA